MPRRKAGVGRRGGAGFTRPANSKTFELLLDVELPVSVSFGRAQVPLKDVLKLTTGSIVELNRSIVEPVEVIVNNCVIARGEVVVVEGNFGVRIHQVISRQERLRTLQLNETDDRRSPYILIAGGIAFLAGLVSNAEA